MKPEGSCPGICARCSTIYGSCCVVYGDNDAHNTVVSREEALLIASVSSCPGSDLFMTESNTEAFIKR
ncbi:MAG TPA: hypothetical protein PK986_03955, partial [Spirochaetota bacterium]|nr:hypothetical protein [Spirochaetota bacterium]